MYYWLVNTIIKRETLFPSNIRRPINRKTKMGKGIDVDEL